MKNDLKNDEEKLMNAIHNNCKIAKLERENKQKMLKFAKKENQRKEKRTNFVIKLALAVILLGIVFIGVSYNEKQVKDCIDSGRSEMFCRLAGE